MKCYAFLFLFGLMIVAACHKQETVPPCIQSKVLNFSDHSCDHGANVMEYRFQGRTVFVFDLGFCGADLSSDVIDSDCNVLGALGGFMGNTKINGEEFSHAEYVRTVWSR